ncbi:serine/threonine protein kinase [Paraliobacillus sediminis]|uniref:serine/threonine protein kinase n=1 Tax=Paraliobacillus sediminis TaxID=1885916 RepID=UPI000E3E90CF|nr:serine/threonine protein kinase [Paraliobacillus sediminis]
MENVDKTNAITLTLNKVEFQLQEKHNFDWLKQLGSVFCVFDQQDSGNISFGIEKNDQKYFVKYAGAKPIDFSGNPKDAIDRLEQAVPVYQALKNPHLINLLDYFATDHGVAVIFKWFDGECLHAHWSYSGLEKYTNPRSPFYRFKQLDVEKRLNTIDAIFSFHAYVELQEYVAVDFYDGSILYDFNNDETKICDIDFYRKSPSINDLGENFWGSNRSKSPEEYELGSLIDSVTNVFNIGAIVFGLLGGELDRSFSKWEANENLYEVAKRAVDEERNKRYSTVKEFYEAWKFALNQ